MIAALFHVVLSEFQLDVPTCYSENKL